MWLNECQKSAVGTPYFMLKQYEIDDCHVHNFSRVAWMDRICILFELCTLLM